MPIDEINGYYYDPNDPDELGDRISVESKLYDTKTDKKGYAIKARDVIMLDAPEVFLSPDTPLLTEAQDVAGAINELFNEGGEGDDGYLRKINDNNSNILIIGIEKIVEEETVIVNNNYGYTKTIFKDSIKLHKTTNNFDGTQTQSTITREFSKSIITSIHNDSGIEIFHAECDEKGNVLGYFDADNNEIEVQA